jgi:hypothetical protein
METYAGRPVATQSSETGYKRAGRLLQDGAALVSIDEYAAREGVSIELIEACGLAGIVQIRKHKGKTYIVDYPLTPYSQVSAETGTRKPTAAGRPSNITKATIQADSSRGEQGRTTNVTQNNPPQLTDRTICGERISGEQSQTITAGSIANLAQKMFLKAHPSVLLSQDSSGDKPRSVAVAMERRRLEPIEKPSEIPPPIVLNK